MNAARKIHWYGGETHKGLVMCGKGSNRVAWTDRDTVWHAAQNKCTTCDRQRIVAMIPKPSGY